MVLQVLVVQGVQAVQGVLAIPHQDHPKRRTKINQQGFNHKNAEQGFSALAAICVDLESQEITKISA